MSWVSFNGVSTESIPGVEISKMPSHKRAAMRYTEYYVKGRDGALHINEGYSNMEVQVTLVLIDATAETRQMVNAWAIGKGKLITSDDPSKAYKATVNREVQWSRVVGNKGYFDTARINFDCEPYMYETDETVLAYTSSGTIANPGTATALPLIKVEGSGNATFAVGGETITINGMTSGVPVFIDCEAGYVYTSSGSCEMVGNFPELPLGSSAVTVGTNTSKLTITPHWRWV